MGAWVLEVAVAVAVAVAPLGAGWPKERVNSRIIFLELARDLGDLGSVFGSGKTSQNAIAAVSYLAEHYGSEGRLISSLEIARERNLPKPIVAKVLTTLSQAAIVRGASGPHGGYRLAVAPEEITLHDVVACFEDPGAPVMCPFGPDWCGKQDPCPMHDSIAELQNTLEAFLRTKHFGIFRAEESRAQ